jgi:aconitate hydratase
MTYLQFESLWLASRAHRASVSYAITTCSSGFRNADDHLYLQTVAAKYACIIRDPATALPPSASGAFWRTRQDALGSR